MSKQSTTRLRRRLTESTPPTTAGDCSRKITKAAAEKQTELSTREPTNGTSATSLFQALIQATIQPTSMDRTCSGATSTRRIQRRFTSTKCGRSIPTVETPYTEDRLQRTSILGTHEL